MSPSIYLFSGPCGCGKSTLTDAFAKMLVNGGEKKQVYVIHGDDFHAGFAESDNKGDVFSRGQPSDILQWHEILSFNWECINSVARLALTRGVDVVIDYIIEDEMPILRKLAEDFNANFYYFVLTANEETLRQRITQRGDTEMIERSLFLKNKLDNMPENQGHILDSTDKSVETVLSELKIEEYKM